MKIWTQSCRFSLRTRKSSKTRGNFHFVFICFSLFFHFFSCFYHFFIMFFSFSLPVAPEIQESHGKLSKTKENEKKNEVANEKKMKIWTQSCRFSLRTRKSSKTRGNFHLFFIFFHFFIVFLFFIIFLSFVFHFPCPWHLKSRKAMKNNEKQWKTIKNKGK